MSGKRLERGMSCDDELEERLRRLKSAEDMTTPPVTPDDQSLEASDQRAIEERLARLKGMDPKRYTMPPITVFQPMRQKTDQQKADDLLKQFVDELKIDNQMATKHVPLLSADSRRLSTDDDIERRLARLRGEGDDGNDPSKQSTVADIMDTEELDDEELEKRLIDRLLAESRLPAVPTLPLDPKVLEVNEDSVADMSSESLPWCQICNEDAVIKCIDCCGDLYCKQCFLDFHDDSDLRKHKTEPFRAPVSQYSI